MARKYPLVFVGEEHPWRDNAPSQDEMWESIYKECDEKCKNLAQIEGNALRIYTLLEFYWLDDSPEHAKKCMEYLAEYYMIISP